MQSRLRRLFGQVTRSVFSVIPVATVLVAGCSTSSTGAYQYDCPEGKLVQLSLLDVSSSGRSEDVLGERLDAIQVDAERVADCEGTLSVMAWSLSSAASTMLFRGDLATSGATEIGRDRKIEKKISETMESIRTALTGAFEKIDPTGSNLAGAFALAADQKLTLKDGEFLEVRIYGDAISTVGSDSINSPMITVEEVNKLVENLTPVDLDGVRVTLVGVGKTGGSIQPPQDYINVVRAYADAMCKHSGATCTILTSITN